MKLSASTQAVRPDRPELGATVEFVRFLADLRRRSFDLVLDLQGLFRSAFLTLAAGARVTLVLPTLANLHRCFTRVEYPFPTRTCMRSIATASLPASWASGISRWRSTCQSAGGADATAAVLARHAIGPGQPMR